MKGQWKDKNGRWHFISKMTDEHLVNTLKYLRKFIEEDKDYVPEPNYYVLEKEYEKRCKEYANG